MRWVPKIPPGIISDNTAHTAANYWADGSNVRWRLGYPETIGGWESIVSELLAGVCRSVFGWVDQSSTLNLSFGLHGIPGLMLFQGGGLYDITPTLARPPATLTNPFTVADASTTVEVDWPKHGLATSDTVIISGAVSVGRITPAGTYAVTVSDPDTFTITHGSPADTAETLGNNPLTTTNASPIVTVADTAHGLPNGLSVTFSGASAVGGITPNGTFPITVVDANSYTFVFTSNASSAATGGGNAVVATVPTTGGGSVKFAPQNAFTAGEINGTGSNGYGTGAYGIGGYGEPSEGQNFPRTWSQSSLGQSLIATPRGGTIYAWDGDTLLNAEPIPNAPRMVNFSIVTPQGAVMAIGCTEEITNVFNPFCIRHSSITGNDPLAKRQEWNTGTGTTAKQYILQGSGEPVAARNVGEYVFVWTTDGLFVGSAGAEAYRFDRAPGSGGLIGPNAVAIRGATARWLGPDLQFYQYTLGGEIAALQCPILNDLAQNIAAAQGAKVHASTLNSKDEFWLFYPDQRDGDGLECSRYVALNIGQGVDGGAWFRGIMDRTAGIDAGPASYPCRVTPGGRIYWHERGNSADGGALAYFIRSGSLLADENGSMMAVSMWPDFEGQIGAVSMTISGSYRPRETPQPRGPYSISPGTAKVDIRASGRYFELEYAGNSSPAFVRVQDSVFDLRRGGSR